jgi:polysaccharide export outer membrane protein
VKIEMQKHHGAPVGRVLLAVTLTLASSTAWAQQAPANGATPSNAVAAGVVTPPDYVIGPEDVLTVLFWRDKDMSSDVAVRPDGKITLPLVNEIQAAGLTPEELRVQVTEAASKFLVEVPTVSVVVKAINSRKVFVTGMVGKPGPYPLTGPTTVLQLLSMAGGLHEYADSKNISIIRVVNGKQTSLRFNYKDVAKRKNLQQNIELKPGDTIIVP